MFDTYSYLCMRMHRLQLTLSHSGIVITLGDSGGPVYVKSKVQTLVSTSSTEAEVISVCSAVQRALPLLSILREFGINTELPIEVYQDNLSSIKIITDGQGAAGKRKLFRVRYGFLKELIDDRSISLNHFPTQHMKADILTKPLGGQPFKGQRATLLNH